MSPAEVHVAAMGSAQSQSTPTDRQREFNTDEDDATREIDELKAAQDQPAQKMTRLEPFQPGAIPGQIHVCLECKLVIGPLLSESDVCGGELHVFMSTPRSFVVSLKCTAKSDGAH